MQFVQIQVLSLCNFSKAMPASINTAWRWCCLDAVLTVSILTLTLSARLQDKMTLPTLLREIWLKIYILKTNTSGGLSIVANATVVRGKALKFIKKNKDSPESTY